MELYADLTRREKPVRCAVIGCGKFATMFLHQARRTPNLHVAAVVDLSAQRARRALHDAGFDDGAVGREATLVTQDAGDVLGDPGIDVVVEATGNPLVAVDHADAAIAAGQHVVMVTVEADVLVGPVLAARAREAGVVYAMASGDQPSLICDLVDWARTAGFEVVAAGKGTKYLPAYHDSTPETVWEHYGFDPADAESAGLNPQMFNSFLDGTKSAIEMAAVCNATGLAAPADGLIFPPCGADDLASVCIPAEHGGALARSGTVEVVSSLDRDGADVPRDLRWGVYVTLAADSDYARDCFRQYGLRTDPSGRFTAMYRPYHLIGLELGVSVVAAGVRGEPTGTPHDFVADVVTVAKRDLSPGEVLDGEGGYTIYGKLAPAGTSLRDGLLPIGVGAGARMRRAVERGRPVAWDDVELPAEPLAVRMRRELEQNARAGGRG